MESKKFCFFVARAAMEYGPFEDVLPIEDGVFSMFVYRSVN